MSEFELQRAGHPRRRAVLVVVCTAFAVVVLDNTVVNIALPAIATDLGAGTAELQLVVDSYVVVFGALLVGAGVACDRFGRRRTAQTGLTVLVVASSAAAIAPNAALLVTARAVMGVGAALVMPAALATLVAVFPEHERPRALAGWAAVAATALAAGPVVGGLVTTVWGWPAVFLLNVPVAVVAMIGFHRLVPESRDDRPPPFDPVGTLLVTTAACALVITGTALGERGGATVPLVTATVAVVGLTAFVRRQRRAARPMVDLSLYTDRRFVGASLAVTALALGTGTALFSLTQYIQLVLGYPPLLAGAAMIPLAAGSIVGAVVGGRLPDLLGSHRTIALGLCVTGAGFLLLVPGSGGGYPVVAAALLLGGLGTGLAGPAASAVVLGSAPPERAGLASALHDTHQQLGVAFGIAALGSVLAGLYRVGLPATVPGPATGSPSTTLDWARATGTPEAFGWVRESFSGAQAVTMGIGGACALVGAVVALATLREARER